MFEFGVNLKRFEIPTNLGGICPDNNPVIWLQRIIKRSINLGLGQIIDVRLRFFLPESLLITAKEILNSYPSEKVINLEIGSQTIFRKDIVAGGNFGAFTANLPATAVKAMEIKSVLIGHSEERADKFELIQACFENETYNPDVNNRINRVLNLTMGKEVAAAVKAGLSIMFCIGETEEEKGSGSAETQFNNTKKILSEQLESSITGATDADIVIAYEPRWAIGPGKTVPTVDYIELVSEFIKKESNRILGRELPVLYGGGLKRENSADIAGVSGNNGGLVALTNFTDPIGFDPDELKVIIDLFCDKKRGRM